MSRGLYNQATSSRLARHYYNQSYFYIAEGAKQSLMMKGHVKNATPGDVVSLVANNIVVSTSTLTRKLTFQFKINYARHRVKTNTTFRIKCNDHFVPLLRTNPNAQSISLKWIVSGKFKQKKQNNVLDITELVRTHYLTKKGDFLPASVPYEKKIRYLELYQELTEYFTSNYGYTLNISHGTLLAAARHGDFIDRDDDFDLMYVSRNNNVIAVAQERTAIVRALRKSRYNVFISMTGHIQVFKDDLIIDLMPSWIDINRHLNISSYTFMPHDSVLFTSFDQVYFVDRYIPITRNYIKFLLHQYGVNWRVPDPSYRSRIGEQERVNRLGLEPKFWEIFLYTKAFSRRQTEITRTNP